MKKNLITYHVEELPDRFYPQYQMLAGGDVLAAVSKGFEHLLRFAASLPPDSGSVTIRFLFDPKPPNEFLQSRLNIFILARAAEQKVIENLQLLLERGPLSRFYGFNKINQISIPWEKFLAGYEIVKREERVEPLHSPEFNYRIPAYYYAINSLESDDQNDYLNLINVFGGITELVLIDLCVQPADISKELREHTRYLARLESINRIWDDNGNDDQEDEAYLIEENIHWSKRTQTIKPLRCRDPLADDILRSQQRFHESLRQPHFLFHQKILAQTPAVAQLLGSVVAEAAFKKGGYRLLEYAKESNSFKKILYGLKELRVLHSEKNESHLPEKDRPFYSGLSRLSHLATVDELKGAFRLPVASLTSPCCIQKNTDPPNMNEKSLLILGLDKEIPNLCRGIPIEQLCKHLFLSGSPGSGKTTGLYNLTLQLNQYDVPFLILEPVKTEHRVLKMLRNHKDKNAQKLADKLEIYTPGNETISPFRFNPLAVQPNITLDEHIDNILSCFMAAMPVSGPLPALLGEALERTYENHNNQDYPPIMNDLVASVEQVLAEKGYSAETNSDIRAALEVRIGVLIRRSIGKVFQCPQSIPSIEHLLRSSTVIEFDRLHTEQSCLLTLFILTNLREYLKTTTTNANKLRYVIIIEEAHNIVGRSGQAMASPEVANPKAFAAEHVVRMLAELRSLGVGIVIADQLPSAVAPEVIKNTTSKLAFRQVAKEDREELGASMLFGGMEIDDIARLAPGEAFFYTEGYHGSRRIESIDVGKQFGLSQLKNQNQKILSYIKGDAWYQDALSERAAIELMLLNKKIDHLEDLKFKIADKIVILSASHLEISQNKNLAVTSEHLMRIREKAKIYQNLLMEAKTSFMRNSYLHYIKPDNKIELNDSKIEEFIEILANRFYSLIMPGIDASLKMIRELIERCEVSIPKR